MRRWLANIIYPESAHLRPSVTGASEFTRGWDACAQLWNKTFHERLARENSKTTQQEPKP